MEANAGEYIKKYLHLKRFPRISLHCKLVPVLYREYEYGLLLLQSSIVNYDSFNDLISPEKPLENLLRLHSRSPADEIYTTFYTVNKHYIWG